MTRKKAKPQHRETVTTEPVNEGGFYKMLWNSMENDLGEPAPVDSSESSPPVVILSDDDVLFDENGDCSAMPVPFKEETLEARPEQEAILPLSENPREISEIRVNIPSESNEDGVTITPPLKDPTPLAESINSLASVTDSTQSTNPSVSSCTAVIPLATRSESTISNSPEPHAGSETLKIGGDFNVGGENGDHTSLVDLNQVCDSSASGDSEAVHIQPAAKTTSEALNILKSLLNESSGQDLHTPECITSSYSVPSESPQINRLEIPLHKHVNNTEGISPTCNLVEDLSTPKAMTVPSVTPISPPLEGLTEEDKFPICNSFIPSKIKLEPSLVIKSLSLLKHDLSMLYSQLLSSTALVSTGEPMISDSPQSPEAAYFPDFVPLPKAIVKMERLPQPIVNNNGVVMSDKVFMNWKRQIVKQRNEEKFRHLKVWRRGRTLLWRECELAGMDRATYNEQVAFIKKQKLKETSSDESSSGDDSHHEASNGLSDCEAESSFSAGEHSSASSPIRPAHQKRLPLSPRTKPRPRKGVKYKSATAVANQQAKTQDEYIVEHTTLNNNSSSESHKLSSLKITLRKTSFNKSEDEQEKNEESGADSENSFTKPISKNKRNSITKRTYRKHEETPKENGQKLLRRENKYYMEDNQDSQALLGRRSDEVENFNLLEKWEIPFEEPTLFRSPRVASKLAQLKNKETFSKQRPTKAAPPKVVERVSKDVRDVLEDVCTRTVEAMLCPDVINEKLREKSEPPKMESFSVLSNADAEFCKSQTDLGGKPVPEQRSGPPAVPVKTATPEHLVEPLGDLSDSSEAKVDESENSAVDMSSETPSINADSELEKSKLGSPQLVGLSPRSKRNKRRVQGWGARKRKKLASTETKSNDDLAGNGAKDSACEPASTQVPVVSEGPGQTLLESGHEVGNSQQSFTKDTDCTNNNENDFSSNSTLEEPTENKEDNTILSATEARVTRSRRPVLDLAPEILANVGIKKKSIKTSGNTNSMQSQDVEAIKPKRQPRKSQRKSKVSTNQEKKAADTSSSANTQVHEVSEGPGEIPEVEHQVDVPTTRVLRSASVTLYNVSPESKGHESNMEISDPQEVTKVDDKVPYAIPESPMSPDETADWSETVRVTRSRQRVIREGPAFIAVKQTAALYPSIGTDKTEHETLPQVKDCGNYGSEVQSTKVEESKPSMYDCVTPPVDITSSQETSSQTSSIIPQTSGAKKDIQESIPADLNEPAEANTDAVAASIQVSPEIVFDADLENIEMSSKDLSSDQDSSSERLAVLDTLNSIRSAIKPLKKTQKAKTPPLPTPSLPGCIDLPLESLILPDELDDDFDDFGDLVVDEEFSEDEGENNPLAVRITKIIQEQNKDDDRDAIADQIKKFVTNHFEQNSPVGTNVVQASEGLEMHAEGRFIDKAEDEALKSASVVSEEAKNDSSVEAAQNNKENVDKSKDFLPKRRDSIDEKTGLPTSLIQRLRDPRIRSKLLSQLEESENTSKEKAPVAVASLNETVEAKPSSQLIVAVRDPRKLRSNINDPRRREFESAPASVVPVVQAVQITPPVEVRSVSKADVGFVKAPIPTAPVDELAPPNEPSEDEEESIKRRPKKAKKEVEFMYKSPLEDLNTEARPSYGRAPPGGRNQRREVDGKRWVPRLQRHSNLEVRPYHHWPQHEPAPLRRLPIEPDNWRTQWSPIHSNSYTCPEPQANANNLNLLDRLPKPVKLSGLPMTKIYKHLNIGNPQPCPIPPPAFDPKEEPKTVTMCDAFGVEVLDLVELPRPTTRLSKEFFNDLPSDCSSDDMIKTPYMCLCDVMDEDIEIENSCGLNFLAADDEYDEALVKCPVVPKSGSDGSSVVQQKNDEVLGENPLNNILYQLPLLKQQYSIQTSQDATKSIANSSIDDGPMIQGDSAPPPPPPIWPQDVDLRAINSKVITDDEQSSKDSKNLSPRSKRSKHRRSRDPRSSSSQSPRRRSPSATSSRRHSRSRSPYSRRSRSRSSERRRRRSSRSPSFKRHSTSISPSRRRHRH